LNAFVAGALSFVSPCVLPLVPGYLAFISGVSLEERNAATRRPTKRQVIITSLAFILGFSLIFIALGASATSLGQYLVQRITLFGKVAGIVIIIFGVQRMGVFKIRFLASLFGAMVVGMAFAFGWSPSIGPALAVILASAAAQETVGVGIRLLVVYSMGLAIPFLLTALAINKFFKIELLSGAVLVITGVLIFTNRFTLIANYLSQYLPTY